MSLRAALLAVAVLLSACGSSAPTDRASEEKVLVAALQGAESGSTFSLQQAWTATGGKIPKGRSRSLKSTGSGSLKESRARFSYSITGGLTYDMVIADGQLYVRPRKGKTWRSVSEGEVSDLYSSIRLDVLRDAVTLGKSITQPVVTFTGSSVTRKYVVTPTSDQLLQLQGIIVTGASSGLSEYLKTASASIELYLTTNGNQLARVVVHLGGVNPGDSVKTVVDSTVDFKKSGQVAPIKPPDSSTPVTSDHLLDPP